MYQTHGKLRRIVGSYHQKVKSYIFKMLLLLSYSLYFIGQQRPLHNGW